jgi:hypothetical protein
MTAAAPSLMPEALAAVTDPSFSNAGLQLGHALERGAVADILVVLHHHVALAGLDGHGCDLVLEAARLLGRLGLVLRGDGEPVLLVAGDLPLLGDVLGRVAHVIAVEGVPQAVLDHGVDHLVVAHLHAVAQMGAVRRLAHRLLAAGSDDRGIAGSDLLHAERHGPQAGAAQLVHAPGRALHRDARLDRGLAGRVLACPAVRIWPRMTSLISPGSTLARLIAAFSATDPR